MWLTLFPFSLWLKEKPLSFITTLDDLEKMFLKNNKRPLPIDPLGEIVSHAKFRTTFRVLAQAVTANAQANT